MANNIIHFPLFGLFFSLFEPDQDLRLRIAGSCSSGLPSFGAVSLPGVTVFRSRMLPLIARALANSGFTFEGTTVFRCGVATEGLPAFEAGCFRLLQGRLQIAGSLSRGLPSFGAVLLPRGLPSFEAGCFRLLQGGGVIVSS